MQVKVALDSKSYGLTKQAVKGISARLPFELHTGMKRTVLKVEKYAKWKAPRKTGATAASITSDVISSNEGVVGSNYEPAMAIDEGARPHVIRPKNAGALTIPHKDNKGRYKSLSRKTKSGRSRRYKRRSYKDVGNAPNKRHLDVKFSFRDRAHHPGTKGHPFLTSAARIADGVAAKEGNAAILRAIKRARRG